jgi:membrane protease YdiL (CAAX protease family)
VPQEPTPQADAVSSGSGSKDEWVPEPAQSTWRWDELRVVGWLYALLLFTSLVSGIGYSVQPEGDFGFWTTLVDAAVIVVFAARYRTEIVPLLFPSSFDRHARKMLAIAAAVQFLALGAVFYLLEKTGIPFERITDEMRRHDYSLWQLLALYSLAPAVFEEIAFRGVMFDRLRRVLGEREGWLVQAAFFSILHLSPVIFPTHFAMGLIFGWLRMRTGSLLPGMILHAAWNAVNIILELYQ